MVDTEGAVVGQINGLSVSSIGDYMFGRPSRITATHRLGDGEVVDIEREVEMGGPIHSKGVLILAGYLGTAVRVRPAAVARRPGWSSSSPTPASRATAPPPPSSTPCSPPSPASPSSSASPSPAR